MSIPEPIAVTLLVIEVLNQLDVDYVIGGSLASARHGTARATMDSDLVVDLNQKNIPAFVAALEKEFYSDEQMVSNAVICRSSFNIIHLTTMFKVTDIALSNFRFQNGESGLGRDDCEIKYADSIRLNCARWATYCLNEIIIVNSWIANTV